MPKNLKVLRATNLAQTEQGNMSAAFLALLICVFAGLCFRMPERVILSTYPLLDFLTRLLTRVLFLLDSKPAGYLLLTGHGKGP